jgi:hypothetical protein
VELRNSRTYRWMLDQARLAGRDLDAIENVHGTPAPVRHVLLLWAALAVTGSLTAEQHAHLARVLAVTEDELRDVWQSEMRESETAELLDHPELRALDRQLDDLD